tara:strand:+ start:1615 stop:2067 length:453 start_codon:yes stop_codon:yes gene_type:complete
MTKIWGPSTWIFFHTIAQKIKPQYFIEKKIELLNLIKSITSNLPCPDCKEHATEIMKSLKPNSIQTKEDFIEMLFYFHNHVNEKLGKKKFNINNLSVYDDYILSVVITNFLQSWNRLPNNISMINEGFRRKIVLKNTIVWFKKNIKYFEI